MLTVIRHYDNANVDVYLIANENVKVTADF